MGCTQKRSRHISVLNNIVGILCKYICSRVDNNKGLFESALNERIAEQSCSVIFQFSQVHTILYTV